MPTDPINEFTQAARAFGLAPFEAIPDGRLHRVDLDDERKGKRSAWYVLHLDGIPAGSFGNWKTGISQSWCIKQKSALTPTERNELAKQAAETRRLKHLEAAQLREQAQRRAAEIWDSAQPCSETHPYLTKKQIKPHRMRLHRDLICIPLKDQHGTLHSLQFISPTGEKRFLTGGRKLGCYAAIGKPADTIYIAEGFATAASVHEETGHAVAIAFDAGNLEPVARVMREKFPDAKIIIAADHDDVGLQKASQAAAVVQAEVIYPPTPGDDFNDDPGALAVQPASVFQPVSGTIDLYSPLPDCNDKGKPLSTVENLQEILRRLQVTVRYNLITKQEEFLIPHAGYSTDNQANASLAWIESWCNRFKMTTGSLPGYLTLLADQNPYNPVAAWIESKPWDGTSRLADLYATVRSKNEPLKEQLMRRWLLSAVAAAYRPDGISAHGVLVFQGGQGLGKTKWFKSLVPQYLGLTQDGLLLDPKDKDSVLIAISHWLVELGEVDATFRRADLAQLKAFLTKQKDMIRRPYAKKESEYARRTVFFASVNEREYLHDPTGSRRFWTIETEWIDYDHSIDMQQLWAEIHNMYRNGETWLLDAKELNTLNEHNEDYQVRDALEERIRVSFNFDASKDYWAWKTSTEILMDMGIDRPTNAESTKAGTIMRKLNGGQSKRSSSARLVLCPPKLI
jgi:putative DNA primase/helicase